MPMLSVIIVSLYVPRSRCLIRISVLSVIIRSMPSSIDYIPNLSILDLLFNQGNKSILYL